MIKQSQNTQEPVFCIIKFGKLVHLESLLSKGELCFNSTVLYNEIEQSNVEKGDSHEGAEWIENVYIKKVNVKHPSLGEFNFFPQKKSPFKFVQYNHNYLTCSFYIIRGKDFENTNKMKINEKMLQFGSHAIIVKQPNSFLALLKKSLNKTDYSYEANLVEYKDLSHIRRYEMNPFIKKFEHGYQKEFRVVIMNQLDRKFIRIGSIKEYSEIVTTKYLIEAEWEVTRN